MSFSGFLKIVGSEYIMKIVIAEQAIARKQYDSKREEKREILSRKKLPKRWFVVAYQWSLCFFRVSATTVKMYEVRGLYKKISVDLIILRE